MTTINNILKFIEMNRYSMREVEAKAGISNGTIAKAAQRMSELSQENIAKIVEHYSMDLSDSGFFVVDLQEIGLGKVIMTAAEKENMTRLSFEELTPFQREKLALGLNRDDAPTHIKNTSDAPMMETLMQTMIALMQTQNVLLKESKENVEKKIGDINANFQTTKKTERVILAHLHTMFQRQALSEAKGNPEKVAAIVNEINKQVALSLHQIEQRGIDPGIGN